MEKNIEIFTKYLNITSNFFFTVKPQIIFSSKAYFLSFLKCIYFYLKGREIMRHTERSPICWFISPSACNSESHVDGRWQGPRDSGHDLVLPGVAWERSQVAPRQCNTGHGHPCAKCPCLRFRIVYLFEGLVKAYCR